MSLEQNKEIVSKFLEDITNWNIDSIMDTLAEDVTWAMPGNTQISGTKTKPEILEFFNSLIPHFPNGFAVAADSAVAEGDYVAVEGRSNAELATGGYYQNRYHWLFEVNKDGKIRGVKEYLDTVPMTALIERLFGPASGPS